MKNDIKANYKKFVSLLLVCSMILGMNTWWKEINVYAEVVEENIQDSEIQELIEDEIKEDTEEIEDAEEPELNISDNDDDIHINDIHFDDENFYRYFKLYNEDYYNDHELNEAIKGLVVTDESGNIDTEKSGYIDRNQLAKITEIEFKYDSEKVSDQLFSREDFYEIDFLYLDSMLLNKIHNF